MSNAFVFRAVKLRSYYYYSFLSSPCIIDWFRNNVNSFVMTFTSICFYPICVILRTLKEYCILASPAFDSIQNICEQYSSSLCIRSLNNKKNSFTLNKPWLMQKYYKIFCTRISGSSLKFNCKHSPYDLLHKLIYRISQSCTYIQHFEYTLM